MLVSALVIAWLDHRDKRKSLLERAEQATAGPVDGTDSNADEKREESSEKYLNVES